MPPLQSTEGLIRGCHPAAGVSVRPTTLSARTEQGPLWSLRRLLFGRWASGAGGHASLRLNSPVSSLVPSEFLPIAGPGGARHCASVQGLVWRQGIPSPTQTDPWALQDACPGALWGHAMESAPTSNPCPGSLASHTLSWGGEQISEPQPRGGGLACGRFTQQVKGMYQPCIGRMGTAAGRSPAGTCSHP